MNVTNLKLCKELYELSGWDDTDRQDEIVGNSGLVEKYQPRYDLGYLLRKLPQMLPVDTNEVTGNWMLKLEHPSHGWNAYYFGDLQGGIADTPEDAACKLAIELIKQKVIEA